MGSFDPNEVDRGFAGTFVVESWWRYLGRLPGASQENPGQIADLGFFGAEVQTCVSKGTQNYLKDLLGTPEAVARRQASPQAI